MNVLAAGVGQTILYSVVPGGTVAGGIGASWIFDGHRGTLDALSAMVEPGGLVVVGEPFWLKEPAEDYLEATGMSRDLFGTHFENVQAGEARGLNLLHSFVSSLAEWDTYEGLKWSAVDAYTRANPEDVDLPVILERLSKEKQTYLRWGRDTLGWAIYVFPRSNYLT